VGGYGPAGDSSSGGSGNSTGVSAGAESGEEKKEEEDADIKSIVIRDVIELIYINSPSTVLS
jgi:hypothetical protein